MYSLIVFVSAHQLWKTVASGQRFSDGNRKLLTNEFLVKPFSFQGPWEYFQMIKKRVSVRCRSSSTRWPPRGNDCASKSQKTRAVGTRIGEKADGFKIKFVSGGYFKTTTARMRYCDSNVVTGDAYVDCALNITRFSRLNCYGAPADNRSYLKHRKNNITSRGNTLVREPRQDFQFLPL